MVSAQLSTSLTQLVTPPHDPFWQTPYRPTPAIHSATSHPQSSEHAQAMATKPPHAQHPPRRTLQCTHMTMIRAHGNHDCQFCGEVPAHGYIYVCCQDEDQAERTIPAPHTVHLSEHVKLQSIEANAYMAEALGMSLSVVKQIREGVYTMEEIDKLFAQRRHVVEVLRKVTTAESIDTSLSEHADQQTANTEPGTQQTSDQDSKRKPITAKIPPCNLQVCQSCKPFLHDRLYAQPATILEGGFDVWHPEDIAILPIHNANVLRDIVMPGEVRPIRPVQKEPARFYGGPSVSSYSPISISSSEYSDSSSDDAFPFKCSKAKDDDGAIDGCSIRDVTNIRGRRESLVHTADQTTPFKASRKQLQFTPDLTESPWSASTNSPPETVSTSLTPLRQNDEPFEASFEKKVGTFAKSASFCGPFRPLELSDEHIINSDRTWSQGDHDEDLHLQGIALTEESVEAGIPDILTV